MSQEHAAVDHSRDAHSLRVAFGREGCPVCTVILESVELAMDSWNYEGFTDVEHRQELIRSRGFCPLHTWQLAQRNNAFPLAVVYREVIADMLSCLDAENRGGSFTVSSLLHRKTEWIKSIKRWFRSAPSSPLEPALFYESCFLCRIRSNVERRVIETLMAMIHSEEIQDQLRQSLGLCRLHFTQSSVYAQEHDPSLQNILVECQRFCLQQTLEEVQELIRKHDYRFSDELHGHEMTSWRRAAMLCAGNAGVW